MNWDLQITPDIWSIISIVVFMFFGFLLVFRTRRDFFQYSSKSLLLANLLFIASISYVAFLILKPEIIVKIKNQKLPKLAILRDISISMQTKDIIGSDEKKQSRDEWVNSFCESQKLSSLEKSFHITKKSFPDPEQNFTDIGTELSRLINDDFDEIILISDGLHNEGPSPVKAATELYLKGTKVNCITTGSDKYMPDIELIFARIPAYCILDEQLSIPYSVHNKFEKEMTVPLKFKADDGYFEELDIKIAPNSFHRSSFLWKPKSKGKFKISISAEKQKDENDETNNSFESEIEVRDEKIKVLLADSLPRWEFRFIKNAISRDPGVDAHFMLFHPKLGTSSGKGYRKNFPDKDEISSFDVLFIGDLGTKELSAENLESIRSAVAEKALGLVLIPGRQGSFFSLENSSLKDLNPIKTDPSKRNGIENTLEAPIELTNYGASHHLTMLEDNEAANIAIWQNLPGVTWNWAVLENTANSKVIANHSFLRNKNGKMPVIVEKNYGSGIVLFMGTDHVWKWRKAVEDKYHYRFWSQAIRWMSHKRNLGKSSSARIFHEPENPVLGEEVSIKAFVTDNLPLSDEETFMIIESDDKTFSSTIPTRSASANSREFLATFIPQKTGKHIVSLKNRKLGSLVNMELRISQGKKEKQGEPADIKIMQAIAKAGGGLHSSTQNANELLDKFLSSKREIMKEKKIRLWTSLWSITSLIIALSIAWSLRKISGRI